VAILTAPETQTPQKLIEEHLKTQALTEAQHLPFYTFSPRIFFSIAKA
jgi:hypothetical protein